MPKRINRDDIQNLMKKVTAAANDDFSRRLGPEMPASLSIELTNGEVIKGEKGHSMVSGPRRCLGIR
jgi:2-methylcitrate dehydratase PrpD